jgi:3-deoxy-D-manno-octulosonic-acid transferase
MELIRKYHPELKILLTFFSPSGYEVRKNYEGADIVCYLPIDTRRNARRFLQLIHIETAFFIKYEFWYNYLHLLKQQNIPVFSVSSIFRENQIFFRWYGKPYSKVLNCITHFYVQNEKSRQLLASLGLNNVTVTGDTRFDRVLDIKHAAKHLPLVETFISSNPTKVFVAGSTLPDEDDECIIAAANANPDDKFLVIPHEQGKAQLAHLQSAIKEKTVLYTQAGDNVREAQVLIVDTVGMLSRLYRYGFAAFVGSGFGGGSPHSVIEPAAYGIPVSFGPIFGVQMHCEKMVAAGAAQAVSGREEFCAWYKRLKDNPDYCRAIGTSKLPLDGAHDRNDLVEVSFSVDTNGILQVYAVDLKSGRRIDVEMERDDGFNETAESVKKAAEDAAVFDVFLG